MGVCLSLLPSFVLPEHLVLSFSYIHISTAFYRSKKKKYACISIHSAQKRDKYNLSFVQYASLI